MKKLSIKHICLVLAFILPQVLVGCSVTLPSMAYSPQNLVRISGEVNVGEVKYLPYLNKQVKNPGQIRNSGPMTISRHDKIDDFVKRAIILEMEQSGVKINNEANYIVSADIVDLYAADMGTTIDFEAVLDFIITNKSNDTIYKKRFTPEPVIFDKNIWSAPQIDYNTPLAAAISQAITMFIQDDKVQSIIRVK